MTTRRLSGTTAVVTGASRGFGRATAAALATHGAHVVGVARSQGLLNELKDELGSSFTPVVADIRDPDLPEWLLGTHRPQTLVLNAGASPLTAPLDKQTWESFSENWNHDVRHVFQFLSETLRNPLEPGSVVVSISSGAALRGSPLSGGYAGAKATVRFLSAYASAEADKRSLGLRITAVLPQLTPATDLGAAGVRGYAERAGLDVAEFVDQLGGILTPEFLAKKVVDVVGDDGYSADAYLLTATELRPLE